MPTTFSPHTKFFSSGGKPLFCHVCSLHSFTQRSPKILTDPQSRTPLWSPPRILFFCPSRTMSLELELDMGCWDPPMLMNEQVHSKLLPFEPPANAFKGTSDNSPHVHIGPVFLGIPQKIQDRVPLTSPCLKNN